MIWYVLLPQSHPFSSLYPQSLNIVESPWLRAIFKMFRAELRESNIPCHTTIRTRIGEVLKEHLDWLEDEMKVSIIFIVHIDAHSFPDITWEDLIHYGHVVRPQSHTLHGGDCALG